MSMASGIWGHAPQKKLKYHVKNSALSSFWELYLDTFTVSCVVIFRNCGVKLQEKATVYTGKIAAGGIGPQSLGTTLLLYS